MKSPERWQRIVELAATFNEPLPAQPDSRALEAFLLKRKAADPLRFPDLSLAVVKLLGRGEYALEKADHAVEGHFGLAVKDYTHSTAPNRRFPDVITQRLLKAALADQPRPKVVRDFAQFDVGDRVQVELLRVDVERGFIDFAGIKRT